MKMQPFQELNMSDVQSLITATHSLPPQERDPLRDKLDRMQVNLIKHNLVWVCIDTEENRT